MRGLLRALNRPVRRVLRHRAELREQLQSSRAGWQVEREIEGVVTSGRTLIAGPWLSEVGYEALYWIPFLRWVKAAFRVDPARVVAVSRGGVSSWYEGIAGRYVEIWDEFDPAAPRNSWRCRPSIATWLPRSSDASVSGWKSCTPRSCTACSHSSGQGSGRSVSSTPTRGSSRSLHRP
jgi:hypothetical protein